MKPTREEIAAAIKLLNKRFASFNMDLLLAYEEDQSVCLTAMVCNRKNSSRRSGMVEFNVCDGLPGERGFSVDFDDLDEALKAFNLIAKHGWNSPEYAAAYTTLGKYII